MASSVKRACDACHRRKVKCDGINPCRNCSSAQLSCTYHAIPQKKGPKGSRAKVISELRETQRQTTLSTKVASRLSGLATTPCSPTLAPTPGLLTTEMIKECTEFFFANMYPTMPILHRGRLEQQAMYADQNVDTYCLLTSLCAFMLIQPGMSIPGDPMGLDSMPGANLVSGNVLLEETLRVRKGYDHLETPTMNSLVTSFFLFGCYFGLDLHNKAWFHLREATTLVHILGLQKEETYRQFDAAESSRRRRLYWLLFVTERAYALQRHRPLSLQTTINLPTERDDPTDNQAHHLHGFLHLVNLFRPFDDAFVGLWNKTRSDCSPSYLAALQKQLTDSLPTYLNSTENQTTDLRTSQQWLRSMVWQMSMQNGYLGNGCEDPTLNYNYPIDISRDLLSMTSQFSHQSMEVHGVGLLGKLFEVACSLTDVLSLQPANPQPFTLGPRDHLHQFMALLSVLRNGDHRFLPLLLSRVHEVLPTLANPMLQTVPETAANNMCAEVDIFDGFGSMAMGVSNYMPNSSQPEFKIETPSVTYDHRIKEISPPLHRPENGENSSFSPVIISPSVEYPGLEGYNPFPDLNSQGMGNSFDGVGGRQVDFKVEFEGSLGLGSNGPVPIRRPPIRQGSGTSYGLANPGLQIPRSIAEQYHHPGLHSTSSGADVDRSSIGNDAFR